MQQPPPSVQLKEKRVKNFGEVSLGYPKRTALQEATRCPQCTTPSCNPGCPMGIDIPEFIRILRTGDVSGALKKIKEQNVLPGVCGRICYAPCEHACILDIEKASIGIRALERYAADHGRERSTSRKPASPVGKKVAVIGSGPAGLTAAAFLARRDYQVTIFEALPFAGGVLRYGVPEFRLPKESLDAEIVEIRALGVAVKTNCMIGRDLSIEEIWAQGFASILLAVGSGRPQWIKSLPGKEASGIFYVDEILLQGNIVAAQFLRRQVPMTLTSKVIVLGADNAALDCARLCVRLGKEVMLVIESTEEGVDIHEQDLRFAHEEGVRVESLTRAVEIISQDQRVCGVKCVRMDFADPEGKGEWRLIPVPDSQFTLNADCLIVSPQRRPNANFLKTISGLRLNGDGTIWTRDDAMTSVEKIFSVGEAVSGYGQVVKVMAAAKKVVEQMHAFLK